MNKAEMTKVENHPGVLSVNAFELEDQTDRLLLSGYNVGGMDLKVYLTRDHQLEVWREDPQRIGNFIIERAESFPVASLVPDKRTYAEDSDFEFAMLLRSKGVYLLFA